MAQPGESWLHNPGAELKDVFDTLAVGADLLDGLRDLPFSCYGHLADRYGVHWLFGGETSTPSSS